MLYRTGCTRKWGTDYVVQKTLQKDMTYRKMDYRACDTGSNCTKIIINRTKKGIESDVHKVLYRDMLYMNCCTSKSYTENVVQADVLQEMTHNKYYTERIAQKTVVHKILYRQHCPGIYWTETVVQVSVVQKIYFVILLRCMRVVGGSHGRTWAMPLRHMQSS